MLVSQLEGTDMPWVWYLLYTSQCHLAYVRALDFSFLFCTYLFDYYVCTFVVTQWCHLSSQMCELATHNYQLSSAVLKVLLKEIAVKSVRW